MLPRLVTRSWAHSWTIVSSAGKTPSMRPPLVQAAEREEALKLAAVGRFCALAFLVKAFEHLVTLAAGVLLARAQLGWQTEILGPALRVSDGWGSESIS